MHVVSCYGAPEIPCNSFLWQWETWISIFSIFLTLGSLSLYSINFLIFQLPPWFQSLKFHCPWPPQEKEREESDCIYFNWRKEQKREKKWERKGKGRGIWKGSLLSVSTVTQYCEGQVAGSCAEWGKTEQARSGSFRVMRLWAPFPQLSHSSVMYWERLEAICPHFKRQRYPFCKQKNLLRKPFPH